MRPERLYLQDIVKAADADAVQRFIGNVSKEQSKGDELRQSAFLQKLLVIGEAAARLPHSFRRRNPDIPWSDVVGFRNFAVHRKSARVLPALAGTGNGAPPQFPFSLH